MNTIIIHQKKQKNRGVSDYTDGIWAIRPIMLEQIASSFVCVIDRGLWVVWGFLPDLSFLEMIVSTPVKIINVKVRNHE
ncbi:hypothetical protein [Thalassospira lucentensis]|uniref:hypothetical protein n=1 Tax=Thalassospira lucentensis TaxID=168935 RepID=UPI00142E676F|nr:hypothetical protein [Thalassospira lucentensis]NIZ03052.1 hypothetical protein [Thalassospira lucentensis]